MSEAQLTNLIAQLDPQPGINRDQTKFESQQYIDGQWCRFNNGRPKKIGGYSLINEGTTDRIRNLFIQNTSSAARVFIQRGNNITYIDVMDSALLAGEVDRTPSGFVSSDDNIWVTDILTSDFGGSPISYIFTAAIPNAQDIAQETERDIYYGEVNDTAALIKVNQTTSGGIIVSFPFLMKFGNDGLIEWSSDTDPTNWPSANSLVISGSKIVAGKRTRGGLLMWSLNELIQVSFDSTLGTFTSFVVDPSISIISPSSIVGQGNTYFWIGNGQFYVYNGVVQELPNPFNKNDFFDNVNRDYAGKIWGWVNKRYSEIWWHYPRGSNTECSDVIIYNYADQIWYDSSISRSAGATSSQITFPLLADSDGITDQGGVTRYGVWEHEKGTDKVIEDRTFAIKSYFETNLINLFSKNAEANFQFRTRRIEKDIRQTGQMYVQIRNYPFPQSDGILSDPYFFEEDDTKIDVHQMGRFVSYRFISNTAGGDYLCGRNLIDYMPGDIRP